VKCFKNKKAVRLGFSISCILSSSPVFPFHSGRAADIQSSLAAEEASGLMMGGPLSSDSSGSGLLKTLLYRGFGYY
jgi:hypothetical protein